MSDPVVLTGEEVIPFTDGFQPFPPTLRAKVRFTQTGLVFDQHAPLSWDEWIGLGLYIRSAERAIHWIIGDWLAEGEHLFGEKYAQAEHETGFSIETLKRDFWVASRFPRDVRREDLTFSHHVAVAALPPESRTALLEKAAECGLSSRELRETVKVYKDHAQSTEDATNPVADPAVVDAVVAANPPPPAPVPSLKPERKYVYRLYERVDRDVACAVCGAKPLPDDTASQVMHLIRQEDSEDCAGESVEVNICLACLFDAIVKSGVAMEVYL